MSQSKQMSVVETVVGTGIKFVWAMILWQTVAWIILGQRVGLVDNFMITGIFTVNSMVIGYFVRRWFNNRENT